MKKSAKKCNGEDVQNRPSFDEVWIAVDNFNIVKVPLVLPPQIWSDNYIGRRILPDVYSEKYGINGFYLETEDYYTRDISVNMRPIVDEDGYITEISTYKIRDLSGSSHFRPVSRDMRLTKKDIRAFIDYLEPTLVPLSEPGAVKSVPPPESVLPATWTVESMEAGFRALREAMLNNDRDTAIKLAEFSRVTLPKVCDSDCHPLIMAAIRDDVELVQCFTSAGAYLYDHCCVDGRYGVSALEVALSHNNLDMVRFLIDHGQIGAFDGKRAMEHIENWVSLELLWPHLKEDDAIFRPWSGMVFGYAEAKRLFDLNSRARFEWSEELYTEFKETDPQLLKKIEKTGAVDLRLDFFVEQEDLVGFTASLKESKRRYPNAQDHIPRRVWTMSAPWFNAARDYLLLPTQYNGNGFVGQFSDALYYLFRDGEYEAYIQTAERFQGQLGDEALYGHSDFPKEGTDSRLIGRILEYMYTRHAPDGYWSDDFVQLFLRHVSTTVAKAAVTKTPQMLVENFNEGLRNGMARASTICEYILRDRDDGVFETAVRAFLKFCEQWHKESGEYLESTPQVTFIEILTRGLTYKVSFIKQNLADRPSYMDEKDLAQEQQCLPRFQKALGFMKTLLAENAESSKEIRGRPEDLT